MVSNLFRGTFRGTNASLETKRQLLTNHNLKLFDSYPTEVAEEVPLISAHLIKSRDNQCSSRILDEREGRMTRSSAIWANDVEANDHGDDKPTSSRASTTSLPFDDMREDDDDEEEDDFFDVETGCVASGTYFYIRSHVLVSGT
eukprot:scaffold7529_cov30-Attheya_sp.AAC.1